MSDTFRCDDKETLVAYLYGEIDADAGREVDRHLRSCEACASEADGLRAVRHDLEAWMPPQSELGFTIVQKPATVLRPSRWSSVASLPGWAQVAAAVLVVAMGAALANLQVRYGSDGLTLTTGWIASGASSQPSPHTAGASTEDWRPALIAVEQSLRNEFLRMKRTGAPEAVALRSAEPAGADAAALLRRVQGMLDASEERQRQQLALRLAQATRDWDMTRRADLMKINQLYGDLQGRAFAAQAGQQEIRNYLRRVSTQPVP